jgi:hypothetical protein
MLQRVVYVSRAVIEFGDQELEQLLVQARNANEQANITGVLFYKGDSFLQVLEGDSAVLHSLLGRIKRDPRHTRMRVVASTPLSAREFGEWRMGFHNLDGWQGPAPEHYQDYFAAQFDFSAVTDAEQRLYEFARRFPDFVARAAC